MIKKVSLKNFTIFPQADLKFAQGLNVFIGENGCGKSHLLKIMYSLIVSSAEEGRKPINENPTKSAFQKKYAEKLVQVFKPETLGRLARRKQGRERCEIALNFNDSQLNTSFSFATSSKSEVQLDKSPSKWHEKPPVFFPTRELLTLYPGFVSVYDQHYLEFNETYRDTCLLLGSPKLKGALGVIASGILKPIEEAMGGNVFLDQNGRFYLSVKGQGNMEIPLVAEGVRKLAMLAQLIANGSLLNKSYLFWDEPEANLNPKMQKLVAKVIYHLCKQGIQVFIATHSLFMLRELEVLSKQDDFNKIDHRYFALRAQGMDGVYVEQGNTVDELDTLVLLDEELMQSDRFMDYED